jgi:hypothetical protein
MDDHTITLIVTVASYLIPVIIAWFVKSPLKKWIPAVVGDVLENLDSTAIRELYDAVDTAPERREWLINTTITTCARYGVTVSYKTAAAVVDHIAAKIKSTGK